MLDAHDVGREAGVSEDVFRSIFDACDQCGRYTTKRMSFHHREGELETDSDSDCDSFDLKLECVFLRASDLDTKESLDLYQYQKNQGLATCKN